MDILHHATPKSSATNSISYHPGDKVLSIKFKSGHAEHLADVPASHFEAMKTADSTGKYYHQHIKGKFQPAK